MKKYLWIELFLLLLIFLSFYYAITSYPNLPDKIPIHFGADGKADVWNTKSLGNVLAPSYVILAMEVLFSVCTLIITKSKKDPLRFVNLPISRDRVSALPPKAKDEIIEVVLQLMVVIKSIVIAMTSYLSYSTIQIALGKQGTLGEIMWLFIAALFVVIGWETTNIYKVVWKAEKPDYNPRI